MNDQTRELAERPQDYLGPNLNPAGLELLPHEIGPGVHALLANIPPKDNNGVIFGRDAALVIDAGINGDVSHQIQGIVERLTDRPLKFLVNTTYHGDHTFGNAAFPESVTIVSSKANRDSMRDLDYEKRMRFGNMRGDENPLASVTSWRKPEVVFDRHAAIDLGGKTVELWHFGPGNGPGDTIVFEPETATAWTGNFLMSAGLPPMLLEGGPGPYLESLRAMRETLPVELVVPGHGPMGDGPAALRNFIEYLEFLRDEVGKAAAAGWTVDETIDRIPTPALLRLPANVHPTPEFEQLLGHLHRLNVLATYRDSQP
ncbi:MBL fold metallo-hydrolase [Nocardia sp. ET3-3]|uniref:MBL fold metallo-hydrolase n=1 Tax=Nocardia terrae TaxID=2675851 RepID=A0A7K1UQT4_9NOCA|nr:MBL fold metallo-hydrolase [Nocardia terrae]MVU76713.1 MBL fold metallo-hydrolase [Nocardia terrae]